MYAMGRIRRGRFGWKADIWPGIVTVGDLMNILSLLSAAILFAAPGGTAPVKYSEGQIWEYKTRVGDEGSLLKIQRIEQDPESQRYGPIYHISVVGIHLHNPTITPILPHAPVSRETLDASVTKLSLDKREFPSADAGISEWRKAHGGVFTISVAEIVEILDQQTASVR
jgi:hypothetical protein